MLMPLTVLDILRELMSWCFDALILCPSVLAGQRGPSVLRSEVQSDPIPRIRLDPKI